MKKINSRQFQKGFAKLNQKLKPGESVEITKRGKPMATYMKRNARPVAVPDFLSLLKNDPETGERILRKYGDSIS